MDAYKFNKAVNLIPIVYEKYPHAFVLGCGQGTMEHWFYQACGEFLGKNNIRAALNFMVKSGKMYNCRSTSNHNIYRFCTKLSEQSFADKV